MRVRRQLQYTGLPALTEAATEGSCPSWYTQRTAKVHILEDEAASRAYIDLMWAEAMSIYHNVPL